MLDRAAKKKSREAPILTPDDRRILLIKKGIRTVKELARLVDRSRSHTSQVWYGKTDRPCQPTREAIAKILGMEIEDLWPEDGQKAA